MADFILGRLKFTFLGEWDTATDYIVDDIVNYNGTAFSCVANHTSTGSFPTDRDAGNWEAITNGLNFEGAFDVGTTYEKNDVVEYGGTTYISIINSNTGNTPDPLNATKWKLIAQGSPDSVFNAKGDLIYRDSASATVLPIGTENQTLQVSTGGTPEWVSDVVVPGTFTADGKTTIGGKVYQGSGAETTATADGLTGVSAVFVINEEGFSQIATKNTSSDATASTDLIAYADNGDNETGWIDMGITSSAFSDATYGVTGPNDGYVFMSAPSGTTGHGNLYLSTSGNGTQNDIVFSTGGFTAGSEKMRLVGTAHGSYNAGLNLLDDVSTTDGKFYIGPSAKVLTVDSVGYVGLTDATAVFTSNTNAFVQFALKNNNSGASASTDLIAYSSNGDNDSGWIDVGITSESYADPAFTITGPDTGYIFMSAKDGSSGSGNLLIGTDETGTANDIIFFTNGFDAGNERVRIIGTGANAGVEILAPTASTSTTTGALRVNGGVGLIGNLNVGGDVHIVGNITLGGSGNTVQTQSLAVTDPIIRMGSGNTTDLVDLGFVGVYESSGTKYTGLVRDASDGNFKLFADLTANPTNTVDFTGATYANFYAGTVTLSGDLAVNGSDITTTGTGTATVFNTNATTLNIGGAATTLSVGAVTGTTTFNSTTASSSTTTGAVKVAGGLGVAGAIYGGGVLNITGGATLQSTLDVTGKTTISSTTKIQQMLEKTTVSGTSATGTINFDALTSAVLYYTVNASGNFTINVRGNGSTSLDTMMAVGESLTVVFMNTNGGSAYYHTGMQIDGISVTPKWQGGSAPTSGNASSIDVYSYTIIKTGGATFTVLAAQSKFA